MFSYPVASESIPSETLRSGAVRPAAPHAPARRIVGPGEHSKQGRLARPVGANQAEPVAVRKGEAHLVESAHQQPVAGAAGDAPARPVMQQPVLERPGTGVVDGEVDRHRLEPEADHRVHTQ